MKSISGAKRPKPGFLAPKWGQNAPKKGAAAAWSRKVGVFGPEIPQKPLFFLDLFGLERFWPKAKIRGFLSKDGQCLGVFGQKSQKPIKST